MVCVTKYQHLVFTQAHLVQLETIFTHVCADFEAELVEFNGATDHVHLPVNFLPKVAMAKLVNSLKASPVGTNAGTPLNCSATIGKPSGSGQVPTSPARRAGGAPISVLTQYIEQQTRPEDGDSPPA